MSNTQTTEKSIQSLSNGIKQWTIHDIFPQKVFRFARYLDEFHRNKLQPLLAYLKEAQKQDTIHLWYTFPGFRNPFYSFFGIK